MVCSELAPSLRSVLVAICLLVPSYGQAGAAQQQVVPLSGPIVVSSSFGEAGKDLHYFGGVLDVGDVNADGYDDILLGVLSWQPKDRKSTLVLEKRPNRAKPALLVFNPANRRYELDTAFESIAPALIWHRRGLIEDLDGDGRNDIFVGSTGVEDRGAYVARCGDRNALILNTVSGYVDASDRLPQVSAIGHGLVADDFDRDGRPDLLILNQTFLEKPACPKGTTYITRSYMISDFSEPVRFDELTIKSSSLNLTESDRSMFNGGSSADLNEDGLPDLILGGDTRLEIALSAKSLSYKGTSVRPPDRYYAAIKNCRRSSAPDKGRCVTPYSDQLVYDIDGDGQAEIIASLLVQSKDTAWVGEYLQAIRKSEKGWEDITEEVFPSQPLDVSSDGQWCLSLLKIDLDTDGSDDLVCSNYAGGDTSDRIWIHRGGSFVMLSEIFALNKDALFGLQRFFAGPGTTNLWSVQLGGERHLVGFNVPSWDLLQPIEVYGWSLDHHEARLTHRYDGAVCSFTVSRMIGEKNIVDPIASGKLKVADAKLVVTRGTWSTGGAATPESFGQVDLSTTEAGMLIGTMPMFAENARTGEGPNLGSVADFAASSGRFLGDTLPDGEIKFPILEPEAMMGKLILYSCARK